MFVPNWGAYIFIRYGNISIFTKFNVAAVRRIGFVGKTRGTTREGPFVVAILVKTSL